MILRNIIINAYFVTAIVYSIELLDNVKNIKYTVNIRVLYNGLNTIYKKYMITNLDNYSTVIEVPLHTYTAFEIQFDKAILLKELIIVFDKINILYDEILVKWNIGEQIDMCYAPQQITRLNRFI